MEKLLLSKSPQLLLKSDIRATGFSNQMFHFELKEKRVFFVKNYLIFISFNSGRFAINNKKQYH